MLILGVKYLILRLGLRGEVRGINGRSKAFIFTWGVNRHQARLTFSKFLSVTWKGLLQWGQSFLHCKIAWLRALA